VTEIMRNYCWLTAWSISVLNMNRETVRLILTNDLNTNRICAKMILQNLKSEQKWRGHIFHRFLIMTGENSSWWCDLGFWYVPETNGESPPETNYRAWISKSKVKDILICFFDTKKTVPYKTVPPTQIEKWAFYLQVLECTRSTKKTKSLASWHFAFPGITFHSAIWRHTTSINTEISITLIWSDRMFFNFS
jgi:hypothetical protein